MIRADKIASVGSDPINTPATDHDEDEMRRHGIERIAVDYFHVDGFRYTRLSEAIAQARRSGPGADRR